MMTSTNELSTATREAVTVNRPVTVGTSLALIPVETFETDTLMNRHSRYQNLSCHLLPAPSLTGSQPNAHTQLFLPLNETFAAISAPCKTSGLDSGHRLTSPARASLTWCPSSRTPIVELPAPAMPRLVERRPFLRFSQGNGCLPAI